MGYLIDEIIKDYEQAVFRIILYSLTEFRFPLGIKNTVRFLRGSKSSFMIKYEFYKLKTYSLLWAHSTTELTKIIKLLIDLGFIEIVSVSDYENMPVLKITSLGKETLSGQQEIKINFLKDSIDRNVILLDEVEAELFLLLAKKRKEIAKEKHIKPFMICSDKTMREIIRQKPLDKQSLLTVKGIGEKFIEKYGDDLLEVIIKNLSKQEQQT